MDHGIKVSRPEKKRKLMLSLQQQLEIIKRRGMDKIVKSRKSSDDDLSPLIKIGQKQEKKS
jgi:hypothetical protein